MIARPLALLFAPCFTGAAEAPSSIHGSGCVPEHATTRFNRHNVGNASVQHAPDNIDLIVMTCPIAPLTPTRNGVEPASYLQGLDRGPARRLLFARGSFG